MPAGFDAEVAELFRDLRLASNLDEAQLANRLSTQVEVVQALEQGTLYALPPWPETARVVSGYGELLKLDVQPLLRRVYAQVEAGVIPEEMPSDSEPTPDELYETKPPPGGPGPAAGRPGNGPSPGSSVPHPEPGPSQGVQTTVRPDLAPPQQPPRSVPGGAPRATPPGGPPLQSPAGQRAPRPMADRNAGPRPAGPSATQPPMAPQRPPRPGGSPQYRPPPGGPPRTPPPDRGFQPPPQQGARPPSDRPQTPPPGYGTQPPPPPEAAWQEEDFRPPPGTQTAAQEAEKGARLKKAIAMIVIVLAAIFVLWLLFTQVDSLFGTGGGPQQETEQGSGPAGGDAGTNAPLDPNDPRSRKGDRLPLPEMPQ